MSDARVVGHFGDGYKEHSTSGENQWITINVLFSETTHFCSVDLEDVEIEYYIGNGIDPSGVNGNFVMSQGERSLRIWKDCDAYWLSGIYVEGDPDRTFYYDSLSEEKFIEILG